MSMEAMVFLGGAIGVFSAFACVLGYGQLQSQLASRATQTSRVSQRTSATKAGRGHVTGSTIHA
jgi:hypothetical protein